MAQYRNTATPLAMVAVLRVVHESRGLSATSRALLLEWMMDTKHSPRRLKAFLPRGTVVAHKTGSSRTPARMTRATNDAALITLPDGRHLAFAVFAADSTADETNRENFIGAIGGMSWEYWVGPAKK